MVKNHFEVALMVSLPGQLLCLFPRRSAFSASVKYGASHITLL